MGWDVVYKWRGWEGASQVSAETSCHDRGDQAPRDPGLVASAVWKLAL